MTDDRPTIQIEEVYDGYVPPFPARKTVERLLATVPPKYLAGMKTVVLRDASSLGHDRRRGATKARGKKVRVALCRGLYHHQHRGEPAWIELFLDNILRDYPKGILRLPLIREMVISEVLFHELGHHIHATKAPTRQEREDTAEKWTKRLARHCFRRRYWYLWPFMRAMAFLFSPLQKHVERRSRRKR